MEDLTALKRFRDAGLAGVWRAGLLSMPHVEAAQWGSLGYEAVGKVGVWYPVDRLDGPGVKSLLRTVEELGYSSFWYPEALGYESLSIAGFMLANSHG